ncbi:hypothetical protein DOTSEDRAFT_28230 [Dothistroma septosporum NZE10]|uniref:Uncharacterized protein n=1 Tax=Dothistroma septosporum (strain NZE10 / CBS 128990) TaxID=675120 RepID=N1PGA0_DOTSN|nr:hypothetical protein DOTSEDRAFT_28230 [Dothistroma septosporum NZE10]
MNAAAQVFGIAELLEAILLQLSTRDILLTQRVSTTFRDATAGSLKFQKALCLRTTRPPAPHNHRDIWSHLNPLFLGTTEDEPCIDFHFRSLGSTICGLRRAPIVFVRLACLDWSEVKSILKTSSASWLQMHILKTDTPLMIGIEGEGQRYYAEEFHWAAAKFELNQTTTMRGVLGMALSLRAAVRRCARRIRELYPKGVSEGRREYEGPYKEGLNFSWKESFTAEQISQIVKRPNISFY